MYFSETRESSCGINRARLAILDDLLDSGGPTKFHLHMTPLEFYRANYKLRMHAFIYMADQNPDGITAACNGVEMYRLYCPSSGRAELVSPDLVGARRPWVREATWIPSEQDTCVNPQYIIYPLHIAINN